MSKQQQSAGYYDGLQQAVMLLRSAAPAAEQMEQLVEICVQTLDADRATIFVYNENYDHLEAAFAKGLEDWLGVLNLKPDQGITGHAFTHSESLLIEDALEDDRLLKVIADATDYQPRGMLLCPIISHDGHNMGVIEVLGHEPGCFEQSDLEWLEMIAAYMPVLINTIHQNASSRAVHDLKALLQVCEGIAGVRSLDQLADQIMSSVTQVFHTDRTTLWLHDEEQKVLWARVAEGLEDWSDYFAISEHQGLAGDVFTTRKPTLIQDAQKDIRFDRHTAEETGFQPRSMMIVPLQYAGSVCMGAIQVMDTEPHAFLDEDLKLLRAIAVQITISLSNMKLYERQIEMFDSFIEALSKSIDSRDRLTAMHSVSVANYAVAIGEKMGFHTGDLRWLRVAGLLHDVGKIGVPEQILTKPGKLTADEYEVMQQHAKWSKDILSMIDFTEEYLDMDEVAPMHHEKLDGSGYPDGLKGNAIPMKARILCVADIFDAVTQIRHYRQPMSVKDALQILDDMTPRQLDTRCVRALKAWLGPYADSELTIDGRDVSDYG